MLLLWYMMIMIIYDNMLIIIHLLYTFRSPRKNAGHIFNTYLTSNRQFYARSQRFIASCFGSQLWHCGAHTVQCPKPSWQIRDYSMSSGGWFLLKMDKVTYSKLYLPCNRPMWWSSCCMVYCCCWVMLGYICPKWLLLVLVISSIVVVLLDRISLIIHPDK